MVEFTRSVLPNQPVVTLLSTLTHVGLRTGVVGGRTGMLHIFTTVGQVSRGLLACQGQLYVYYSLDG